MKFVKRLLLICLVVILVLAAIGLLLPQRVKVERAITIDAAAHDIYPLIIDFRQFNTWSPWARKDADTEYRFEGPESGVGSKMYWSSEHPQVGSGNQVIIESEDNAFVKTRLDFGAQGQANAYFNLSPDAKGTSVVWGFTSDFGMDLIGRYMGLFFDSWIGADYEAGLANLKKHVETNK